MGIPAEQPESSAVSPTRTDVEYRARRRIALRLLPFLWLLYMIAFLDRVNVAYAALEMTHDLRFSDRVFGLGAGIFFIGIFPGPLFSNAVDAAHELLQR